MWGGLVLVWVVALVEIAHGAYFYVPPYREDLVDKAPAADLERRDASSFKIVRKPWRRDSHTSFHGQRFPASRHNTRSDSRLTKRLNLVPPPISTRPDAAGIGQDGTDYSYFVEAAFGTSGTKMYLLIDTGASSTWVMGSACTTMSCQSHRTFGADDSTTYETAAGSFSNFYGTGNVSGTIASDDMELAGFKLPMTFGVANQTSDEFNHFPMDGILGLSLKFGNQPTFLQALVASRKLKDNQFAVNLPRASDGVSDGEITFGEPKPDMYSGSFKYTDLVTSTNGDWAIELDNVGFDDKQAGVTGRNAYIDTGTSYIFGPKDDVAKFHALVPGATTTDGEIYTIPCSTNNAATFTFSGQAYSVSSKDWIGPEVNGICISNIFGKALVADSWLLGDTFLKNVYSLFDIDNTRIGFALHSSTTSATAATATNGTSATTGDETSAKSSPFASKEQEGAGIRNIARMASHVSALLAVSFWLL